MIIPAMTLIEFEEMLGSIDFLEVEDGAITEGRNKINADKPSLLHLSLAELRAIDKRLPAAIEGQLEVSKVIMNGKPVSTIYAHLLKRTIMVWHGKEMIHTLEAGAIPYQGFVDIEVIKLRSKRPEMRLTLYGSRVHDFTSSEGVTIKVAERTLKETFTISPKWLEENYPGWKNRYLAASALGYTEEELVKYTLPENLQTPNVDTSIAGLTFE